MAQFARPSADSADGLWTDQAGGTSLFGALDESVASDSDYIQSGDAPSADVVKIKLGSLTDPVSSTGHVVRYRIGKTGTGTVNLTARLVQGTTTIAEWAHTDIAAGPTDVSQTLTGPQADSITNYADLYVEFQADTASAFDPLTSLTWAHYHIADTIAQADASAVSSWADSSGNSKTATQATSTKQPTYRTNVLNGHAVVRGDGGDGLQMPAVNFSGGATATIYLVANQTVDATTAVIYELTGNAGSTTGGVGVYRESGNTVVPQVSVSGTSVEVIDTGIALRSAHKIIAVRVDVARRKQRITVFVNGRARTSFWSANTTTTASALANAAVNLMARNNGASVFQTGDLAFAAAAATRHSTTNLRNMISYLSDYYGITTELPGGVVVFDGSSNLDAVDPDVLKKPFPAIMRDRWTTSYDTFNLGLGGQTLSQEITRYASTVAPLYDSGVSRNVYLIMDGVNDFANGGSATHVSAATVYSRLVSLCDLAKATGFTVGAFTLPANNNATAWGGTNQAQYMATDRDAFNTSVRTDLVQNGHADFIIDLDTDTRFTDYTSVVFESDQAHFSATGHAAVADLLEDAWNAHFGTDTTGAFASDTFTDTAGTEITLHGPWIRHSASSVGVAAPVISDANRLRNQSATPGQFNLYYHREVPSSPDYDVQAGIVLRTDDNVSDIGVVGRMDTSANTGYWAQYATSANAWQLYKFVAGSATQLGSNVAQTLTAGQEYTVKLEMRGTAIKVYVDGSLIITQTDSAITAAGRAGFELQNNGSNTTGLHLDNFVARMA